jgi:two-component system invasion response regulator UvrY
VIKVLLVDDHDLVRTGVKRLLEDAGDIKVVGEAGSGEDALRIAKDAKPNVVLMDANMPGMGGLEATKRLLRQIPEIKIIALTVHGDEPFPSKFLQAGAHGYLTKGADVQEMVRAIRQVNVGRRYIAADVAQQMALRQVQNDGEENPFESLSERETQVMLMVTQGIKVQEIADKLCLSPKTVNSYRYRLFDKLKVTSDVELTHLAIRHGVVQSS